MEMKTMGELMIPLEQYPHINHRATLREAIEVIIKMQLDHEGVKSLPRMLLVFDDINQLVGLLRRRDILAGLEPETQTTQTASYQRRLFDVAPDPNLAEIFFEKSVASLREMASRPVTDVMIPPIVWVEYGDHLSKGMFEIVSNDVSLLPVIRDKRVVGVVRTVDLLREVHRLIKRSTMEENQEA